MMNLHHSQVIDGLSKAANLHERPQAHKYDKEYLVYLLGQFHDITHVPSHVSTEIQNHDNLLLNAKLMQLNKHYVSQIADKSHQSMSIIFWHKPEKKHL